MTDIKIRDVVDFMANAKGTGEENLLELDRRFPNLTRDQFERAYQIRKDEVEQRAKAFSAESEMLSKMAGVMKGLPEGTTFDDAVRIKAEQGDAFAVSYLKHINSTEQRTHSALLMAAFLYHPDWHPKENGHIKWIGKGSPPALIDETALIDWLQTNHPALAREIERSIDPE